MDVSVIVPTFNRSQSLARCLSSMPLDVEIIVVDDGSSDRTREVVGSIDHPGLRYVRQSHQGPAVARNLGVTHSAGSFLVFTDDDCVPVSPWPWPLVWRLGELPTEVAGVGGRVLAKAKGLISRYYTYHRILEPAESCSYLVTANCAYRREALESAGGFDEAIRHAGGEDPGLSFAIRANGYQLAFEPRAVVMHDFRESVIDFGRTFYRYGKGCALATRNGDLKGLGASELKPQSIRPKRVREEVAWVWRRYERDSVPGPDRICFILLGLLQRLTYSLGWRRGTIRRRDKASVD